MERGQTVTLLDFWSRSTLRHPKGGPRGVYRFSLGSGVKDVEFLAVPVDREDWSEWQKRIDELGAHGQAQIKRVGAFFPRKKFFAYWSSDDRLFFYADGELLDFTDGKMELKRRTWFPFLKSVSVHGPKGSRNICRYWHADFENEFDGTRDIFVDLIGVTSWTTGVEWTGAWFNTDEGPTGPLGGIFGDLWYLPRKLAASLRMPRGTREKD